MATTTFVWTANGNWIAPPGVTSAKVEVIAGGGGGGGRTTNGSAGGGGGGAYSRNNFTPTAGTTYPYVVGAGGAGGTTTTPHPGGNSGFGTSNAICLAEGGRGVANNTTTGGAGGAAANGTGDQRYDGGQGATGTASGGGGGGSAGGYNAGGLAGAVTAGGGYGAGTLPGNAGQGGNGAAPGGVGAVGNTGVTPGGGAGGANKNGTTFAGGTAGPGTIWLTYTTPLASALNDTFSAARDANKWGAVAANAGTGANSAGNLSCTVASGNVTSDGGYISLEAYDLTGSSVCVKVPQIGADSANVCTRLDVQIDATHLIGIGVISLGTLSAYYQNGAAGWSPTVVPSTTTYNATVHAWWRIRESSGTTYWEYSNDGGNWNLLTSAVNPITVTSLFLKPHAYEAISTTAAGRTALFDNFNLPSLGHRWETTGRAQITHLSGISPWYAAGYAYKKALTIASTNVSGGADLPDFPLLVSYTDPDLKSTGSGGKVTSTSGFDIIFTDAAQTTKLDHEIERYDPTTGTLVMWVRIPTLSHTDTTLVYCYFSNSFVTTTQENVGGVWDSAYVGVWHLKEDPTGGAPQMFDSSGTGNSLTVQGTWTAGQQTPGQIGGSVSFNGSDDGITKSDTASLTPATDMSLSCWINATQTASAAGHDVVLLYKNNTVDPWFSYALSWVNPVNTLQFSWKNSTNNDFNTTNTTALTTGQWYYLTYTKAGGVGKLYLNGSDNTASSPTISGTLFDSDNDFQLSRVTGKYYSGLMDEVRMSSSARTAGWIATEYANQHDPSSFLTVGILQTQAWNTAGRAHVSYVPTSIHKTTGRTQTALQHSVEAIGRIRMGLLSLPRDGTARVRTIIQHLQAGTGRARSSALKTRDTTGRVQTRLQGLRTSTAHALSAALSTRDATGHGRVLLQHLFSSIGRVGLYQQRVRAATGRIRPYLQGIRGGTGRIRLLIGVIQRGIGRTHTLRQTLQDATGRASILQQTLRDAGGRVQTATAALTSTQDATGRIRSVLLQWRGTTGRSLIGLPFTRNATARLRAILQSARVGRGRTHLATPTTRESTGRARLLLQRLLRGGGRTSILQQSIKQSTAHVRSITGQGRKSTGRISMLLQALRSGTGRASTFLQRVRAGTAHTLIGLLRGRAGTGRVLTRMQHAWKTTGHVFLTPVGTPKTWDITGHLSLLIQRLQQATGHVLVGLAQLKDGTGRSRLMKQRVQDSSGRSQVARRTLLSGTAHTHLGKLKTPEATGHAMLAIQHLRASRARTQVGRTREHLILGRSILFPQQLQDGRGRTRFTFLYLRKQVGRIHLGPAATPSLVRAYGRTLFHVSQTSLSLGRYHLALLHTSGLTGSIRFLVIAQQVTLARFGLALMGQDTRASGTLVLAAPVQKNMLARWLMERTTSKRSRAYVTVRAMQQTQSTGMFLLSTPLYSTMIAYVRDGTLVMETN